MIEYIDLTKRSETEVKKEDYITLQLEAMRESTRESLSKRQAYSCLHEMQGVIFRYVSAQLDRQKGVAPAPLQQQQDNQLKAGYRNLLYADL